MRYLPNGQWTLEPLQKSWIREGVKPPSIDKLMGKTHTVEVHPDIDHLYNVKGHIKESGRPHLHIGDLKQTGKFGHIIDRVPRDARGKVTPDLIDQHIAKLPKHKVEISVAPFDMEAQKHRNNVPQYVASVGMHPDTLSKLPESHRKFWDVRKHHQHELKGHPDQIGWARIDPHRVTEEGETEPNNGHWHLDEIQSDFNNSDKLKIKDFTDPDAIYINEVYGEKSLGPEYEAQLAPLREAELAAQKKHYKEATPETEAAWNEANRQLGARGIQIADEVANSRKKQYGDELSSFHSVLSHSHEDPQHLVHSAINQLARQHGIKSTSMDLPNDQAAQSGLRGTNNANDPYIQYMDDIVTAFDDHGGLPQEKSNEIWEHDAKPLIENHSADIHFKSALNKLGESGIREWTHLPTVDQGSWQFNGNGDAETWKEVLRDSPPKHFSPNTITQLQSMSPEEKDALSRYSNDINQRVLDVAGDHFNIEMADRAEYEQRGKKYKAPVHFRDTYDKRPRKLGMQVYPKPSILGHHPNDEYHDVQYAKLHKNLAILSRLLKALDD